MTSATGTQLVTVGPCAGATTVWSIHGHRHVTVVAKTDFRFVPGHVMAVAEPTPIRLTDERLADGALGWPNECAPFLSQCDVVVRGQAVAADRAPRRVRVAVFCHHLRFDEQIEMDRGADPNGAVARFRARSHATRCELLEPGMRERYEQDGELVEGFDWNYFQAGARELRCSYLAGDEWILLEGFAPEAASRQSRLPGLAVETQVAVGANDQAHALSMNADMLLVDALAGRCSLVWRGSFVVPDELPLDDLRVSVAVPTRGQHLEWPSSESPVGSVDTSSEQQTVELSDADTARASERPATPFEGAGFHSPPPLSGTDDSDLETTTAMLTEQPPATTPTPFPAEQDGDESKRITVRLTRADLPGAPWTDEAPDPPTPRLSDEQITHSLGDLFSASAEVIAPELAAPGDRANKRRPAALLREQDEAPSSTLAAVRERLGPAVPIINDTSLSAVTMRWQLRPPKDTLIVIVKASFELSSDGTVVLAEQSALPTGDIPSESGLGCAYASDFAPFKPCADVVLTGHGYAAKGKDSTAYVKVQFGNRHNGFVREFAVFGPRYWQRQLRGYAATAPEFFDKVALSWEHAFGGPDYPHNPAGSGWREHTKGHQQLLPQVEDPECLVRRPSNKPKPACPGPIAMTWPARWSKLGTYDKRWFKHRWPYFPEDFDWRFFQSAPAPQQLHYLRGDEPFELVGVHPDQRVIRGRLPGLRPHCYRLGTVDAGDGFGEVALRLDTVHFDADAMQIHLVWRGLTEVSEETAPEIALLFVRTTTNDSPKPSLEQARDALRATLAVRAGPELLEPDSGPPINDVTIEQEPSDKPPTQPELDETQAEVQAATEQADGLLKRVVDKLPAQAAAPPEPPTIEKLQPLLAAMGWSEQQGASLLAAMTLPEPDDGDVEIPAPAAAPPSGREFVLSKREGDETLDGLDLAEADLSGLDLSGCSLVGANLKGAQLRGTLLAKADLTEAQLGGADLSEADLKGATMIRVDATRTELGSAKLCHAKLAGADFSDASATGSDWRHVTGEGARLCGCALTQARFDEAQLPGLDLSACVLDGARFDKAHLPRVRLYDARGSDVCFSGAELTDARGDMASLLEARFDETQADGSVWEHAVLHEANFTGSTLVGASFNRAGCERVIFSGADLRLVHLEQTALVGASFSKANLMEAVLIGADLSNADLQGANLHSANTWKATLTGARLENAITTGNALGGVR